MEGLSRGGLRAVWGQFGGRPPHSSSSARPAAPLPSVRTHLSRTLQAMASSNRWTVPLMKSRRSRWVPMPSMPPSEPSKPARLPGSAATAAAAAAGGGKGAASISPLISTPLSPIPKVDSRSAAAGASRHRA
jgi:hypothetical protein